MLPQHRQVNIRPHFTTTLGTLTMTYRGEGQRTEQPTEAELLD